MVASFDAGCSTTHCELIRESSSLGRWGFADSRHHQIDKAVGRKAGRSNASLDWRGVGN